MNRKILLTTTLLLLVLAVLPLTANNRTKIGLEILGFAENGRYRNEIIRAGLPPRAGIGIFMAAVKQDGGLAWDVRRKAVRRFLRRADPSWMRFQGFWYDNHNFSQSRKRERLSLRRAEEQAAFMVALKKSFPDKDIYYSPFVEYQASRRFIKQVYRRIRYIMDEGVELVFNPINRHHHFIDDPRVILELHHEEYRSGLHPRMALTLDGLRPSRRAQNGFRLIDWVRIAKRDNLEYLKDWMPLWSCHPGNSFDELAPRGVREGMCPNRFDIREGWENFIQTWNRA